MEEFQRIPLLDLGNVIVRVDFEPFFLWLQSRSKLDDLNKIRALLTSSLFFDFEFGNIPRQEFARRVRGLYQAEFSDEELEEKFCGIFPGLVDGMEDLLRELAAMGPVYCLTNTNELHLQHCLREFSILHSFTKIFSSYQLKRRKPYPGIYRDVAREIGVDARLLVFVDDSHANVKGAIRAGLEAHVFSDRSQVQNLLLKENAGTDDIELGAVVGLIEGPVEGGNLT